MMLVLTVEETFGYKTKIARSEQATEMSTVVYPLRIVRRVYHALGLF